MAPEAALAMLGGVGRWAELTAHHVPRRALLAACRSGRVVTLGRGLYCLPGTEDEPVTQAVDLRGVLSCGSAAVHHGLELFGAPALVHVSTASGRRAAGLVVHRGPAARGRRATSLLQTLRDCCRCLPLAQAVSVLDSAVRQGRAELDELRALVPRSGRTVPAVQRAVSLVDPASQSVLESAARVLFVTNDVASVVSQVRIERVGWVDLLLDGWLVIEVDGYAVHRERFAEDRRRDAELVRQGFGVLRFTYRDIERRPGWVLAVVQDTLRCGGPGPHRAARER